MYVMIWNDVICMIIGQTLEADSYEELEALQIMDQS